MQNSDTELIFPLEIDRALYRMLDYASGFAMPQMLVS